MQAHERVADEAALKRQAGCERFGDDGIGGRIFHAVGAVTFLVK